MLLVPTFTLSIESLDGSVAVHPYHLGTIEAVARSVAEEIFLGRQTIRTVALIFEGRLFDVFDGQWLSDIDIFDDAA